MSAVGVSLTTFVDFAAATGTAKIGQLERAKRQYSTDYDVAFDYWFKLRKAIIALHDQGLSSSALNDVLTGLPDKKVANYTLCVDAYKKWLGRKRLTVLPRRRHRTWASGDLIVRINPELFVEIGSEPYAVKLYFSAPPITRARLDIALHLIRKGVGSGYRAALLDIRRGKLHSAPLRPAHGMDALLEGEARMFIAMWEAL